MTIAKQQQQVVQLIRVALMAGVLMFGAGILFVQRQPGWKPGTLPPAVGYALAAYAIVALSIAAALRGRVLREPDPGRRPALLIMAAGEAAGLFGGVIFSVTGQGQWYLLGLLAMVVSFALLRPTRTT